MPKKKRIPKNTGSRLALYLREITKLENEGKDKTSSAELGDYAGLTNAQVRKDLSYFGQFGVSGAGYDIPRLKKVLRDILGKKRLWPIALVGVGNIGSALLHYQGFKEQGFIIQEAFDADPKKIGESCGGVTIKDARDIGQIKKDGSVRMAIIAVPSDSAQDVANKLLEAGVKSILSFAPVVLKVSSDVTVKNIDLSSELENLSFILTSQEL